ncbi:MAG: DUF2244 domain-containing protein [Rhodospirillales bacterium]|nr:DUF2244 domain-containing protein [Rhodospirillales bacterium]
MHSRIPTSRLVFSTVLRRNRSAHLRAVTVMVAVIGSVLTVAGIGFVIVGAWPVVGFFGLEGVLLVTALHLHHRRGREQEIIDVTDRTLTVRRVDHRGRCEEWAFPAFWVRIDPIGDGAADGPLEIRCHGRSVFVGKWMAPTERLSLAEDLRRALQSGFGASLLPSARSEASEPPCAPCRPAPV